MFVFGASGHAKVVIDVIEREGSNQIAAVADDDARRKGQTVQGYSILGGREDLLRVAQQQEIRHGIVAVGDNRTREEIVQWLGSRGFEFFSVIDPTAVMGRGVVVREGSVVMPGAIVNTDSVIGAHAIVNTGASVDHDCQIGDFVHLAPGTTLCGGVVVGRRTFLGAGVTVIPNRRIGSNVIVGAGSTVIKDLENDVLAKGTPARPARAIQSDGSGR